MFNTSKVITMSFVFEHDAFSVIIFTKKDKPNICYMHNCSDINIDADKD